MPRFSDDLAVLRDRMEWDTPEQIVRKMLEVGGRHSLDRPCPTCPAEAWEMCRTPTGKDRAVVHTERTWPRASQ